MSILISLTPFILFAVASRFTAIEVSLIAAALLSFGLIVHDRFRRGGTVKVLEAGTAILFGGLAVYSWASGAQWSLVGVRLAVDAGLFAIALGSILIRLPFTLQFAREQTPREFWDHPQFWAINYLLTGAWTATFAIQVVADLVLIHAPAVPAWIPIAAIVGSFAGAVWFTGWYPARERRRAEAAAAAEAGKA